MRIVNEQNGQIIELEETNNIKELENQLMLLGMNGLFYSPWAREIQLKIEELKR